MFAALLFVVGCLPLLDLVESLELGHGDEDDNSLLAALDLDLLGARDLEGSELSLELRDVGLEVKESLSDNGLDLRGGAGGGVSRAEDLLLDGSHGDYMRTESVVARKQARGQVSQAALLLFLDSKSSSSHAWSRRMLSVLVVAKFVMLCRDRLNNIEPS